MVAGPAIGQGSGGSGSTGQDSSAGDSTGRDDIGESTQVSSAETSGDSSSDDGPPVKLDVLWLPDLGTSQMCDLLSISADPVEMASDIIVAVDTSGSMTAESDAVQTHLNGFASRLAEEGLDTRVVLIAASSSAGGPCIDGPLGSGQCPDDSNEPGFRHLQTTVESWDALRIIVDEHRSYADLMRRDSIKQILVISDDNSWNMTAEEFDASFVALDDGNFGYAVHGIVATSPCPESVSLGTVYEELADQTDGTIVDLCSQDFEPLFERLADGVIERSFSCSYPISEVRGWPSDSSTVAVDLAVGSSDLPLQHLDTAADCATYEQGWYVNDPDDPEVLTLCPASCRRARYANRPRIEASAPCGLSSD